MSTIAQYKVNDHILNVESVPIDVLINIPVVNKEGRTLGRAILTKQIEANAGNGTFATPRRTMPRTRTVLPPTVPGPTRGLVLATSGPGEPAVPPVVSPPGTGIPSGPGASGAGR